jgi:cellulose synthase/poly-beta-1,6-N-acetylglucosamine synthase-like glycosyltransferase
VGNESWILDELESDDETTEICDSFPARLQSIQMSMKPSDPMPSPMGHSIGVIIPTYNRAKDLMNCLRHLEAQTWKDFEVFIVDDGSTDDTQELVESYQRTASFQLRYLRQSNSGPAAARNQAIAKMDSPVSILIGDDIFPVPDFVRIHLDFHRAHPQLEAVAVGFTRWSERGQTVTSFMRWLDRDGIQFAYGDLLNGVPPSWKHFYTSNLSFKTAYLQQNRFYEGFRKAAVEDIELGYRLAQKHGLSMFFLPEAIADHLHPTTFDRACKRAIDVGASSYLFDELWPERRPAPTRNLFKRFLIPVLVESRVILPALTKTTQMINRLWCPNPLLTSVLALHQKLGYKQEAARASQKP